ncbi:MAG: hypothetical protein ACOYLB_06480, partial [Phototrophicaceae bacterium]
SVWGRYSVAYALALVGYGIVCLGWATLALVAIKGVAFLPKVSSQVALGFSVGCLLLGMGVTFTDIEPQLKQWVWLNLTLGAIALLLLYPPKIALQRWQWIGWGLVVAFFLPNLLTVVTIDSFNPDEAQWIDYGSSWFVSGHVYNSTLLEEPVIIKPGLPWQIVPYAWLVEQFGNTVRVGRVVNLLTYYVAGIGLFLATRNLYGGKTATITSTAFLMSAMFIPEWDYAPKHLLTVVGTWTLYAVTYFRTLSVTRERIVWSAFIGLVVTASLNVHAGGVVFAGAWSLWYMGRFIKERNRNTFLDALGFGAGALIGVIIYWVANLNPVGGLHAYLDHLRYYRVGHYRNPFFFYTWDSALERVLILAGIVFLLWRRQAHDRFVSVVIGLTVGTAWFLDTQGYIWHFGMLYFIPIGVLLMQGTWTRELTTRTWVIVVVLGMLTVQMVDFVQWKVVGNWLRTGELPTYLYDELKTILPAYVTEDDVLYSTHQLLWVFPNSGQPRVISHASEVTAMVTFNVDEPIQVWERVKPTVIIFVEDHMNYDPGMVAYLEEHPFELCHTFTVQDRQITILRPDCSASPVQAAS